MACFKRFFAPEGEKLAKKITKNSFADKVMFQNSVEQRQLRQLLKLQEDIFFQGKAYKNRIICIKNSFHGRTIAAIMQVVQKK